jgi:hypothetical protein
MRPAAWRDALLSRLVALKSRALRRGVWHRARPAARALIDAAILYLRRGGRVRSPALVQALARAVEEVFRLAAPAGILARLVGLALARIRGVRADEERALAMGLQWLNTPLRWRRVDACLAWALLVPA